MANIYIILLDVTRGYSDQQQMQFHKVPALSNVLGYAEHFAKQNRTAMSNIRLYVAESKKVWDQMSREFVKRAYFRPAKENAEPLFG